MAFLDEIATYVAAGTTSLTVGTNLFKNTIPVGAPDTSVGLYQTAGAAPSFDLSNSTGPVFERPSLQVMSRSTSYVTAESNAQTVYKILAPTRATVLSGTTYLRIDALQSPFNLGTDDNERHQVVCNFNAHKKPS